MGVPDTDSGLQAWTMMVLEAFGFCNQNHNSSAKFAWRFRILTNGVYLYLTVNMHTYMYGMVVGTKSHTGALTAPSRYSSCVAELQKLHTNEYSVSTPRSSVYGWFQDPVAKSYSRYGSWNQSS